MSTGKNIAILASCLHTGGAERVAGLLSKQLSKLYNVYLFLGDVQTIVYDYGGTIVALGDLEPLSASAILRNKRKFQIDVSISFVQYLNFLNIRTKQGERVIVSERSSISPMPFSDKLQINRYYPYADEIVACSYGVKEDLFTHGVEGNVQVIYNFIEKQIIVQKGKQELPNEVEEFLGGDDFFVHVGRLGVEKNQKRLIVQFAIFRETSKRNMKLLIVGSGPLHAELQQFVEEKALKKFVKIIPYDKNPFRYVAKAKAFLLSSHYEGLPNVLLEAMTLGCPIIASDCLAGPRELLKGEMDYVEPLQGIEVCDRGILVENRETEDDGRTHNMADAMERISKDFVLAETIGRNAMDYMEQYDNHNILQQWVGCIEGHGVRKFDCIAIEEEMLKKAKLIIIYGAGHVGKGCLRLMRPKYHVDYFAVTHPIPEKSIMGVPVVTIDELLAVREQAVVVVGVGIQYQGEVVDLLHKLGFHQLIFSYISPL